MAKASTLRGGGGGGGRCLASSFIRPSKVNGYFKGENTFLVATVDIKIL